MRGRRSVREPLPWTQLALVLVMSVTWETLLLPLPGPPDLPAGPAVGWTWMTSLQGVATAVIPPPHSKESPARLSSVLKVPMPTKGVSTQGSRPVGAAPAGEAHRATRRPPPHPWPGGLPWEPDEGLGDTETSPRSGRGPRHSPQPSPRSAAQVPAPPASAPTAVPRGLPQASSPAQWPLSGSDLPPTKSRGRSPGVFLGLTLLPNHGQTGGGPLGLPGLGEQRPRPRGTPGPWPWLELGAITRKVAGGARQLVAVGGQLRARLDRGQHWGSREDPSLLAPSQKPRDPSSSPWLSPAVLVSFSAAVTET